MTNKIEWINSAKGIGIMLVVYGHVARGLVEASISGGYVYQLNMVDNFIYMFHMPLFFLLSGLFLLNSFDKYGYKGLVFNKLETILYPFVLWSLLQGGIEAFLSNYTNGSVSVSEVFGSLFIPRAQFWFLYALFIFFCMFGFLLNLNRSKLFLFFCVVLSLSLYLFGSGFTNNFIYQYFSSFSVFFLFGVCFKDEIIGLEFSLFWGRLFTFLLVPLVFFLVLYFDISYLSRGFSTLIFSMVMIVFIIYLSKINKIRSLALLGRYSMFIYLAHILAGSGARVLLDKLLNITDFWVHLFVGVFSGLVFPLIAVIILHEMGIYFLERFPRCR
ncbi:acyltransferase [Neptunomonas sp. CHC150]|uniref:acyltransferase family protein n=1 Tax=Neptunomonas sp. CHC150 TaxID=2998324 RepID=UPI0025AF6444|nr:acyltransferase [Neptunomonas sp. CHC150]MDN2661067.1 acyltransferase [Neptunomonas sp. CHC150]